MFLRVPRAGRRARSRLDIGSSSTAVNSWALKVKPSTSEQNAVSGGTGLGLGRFRRAKNRATRRQQQTASRKKIPLPAPIPTVA